MKVKFFLFSLLFLVVLYGGNPANMRDLKVQAQMEKKNWHEEAFFALHYDIHHNVNDTEVGGDVPRNISGGSWKKLSLILCSMKASLVRVIQVIQLR